MKKFIKKLAAVVLASVMMLSAAAVNAVAEANHDDYTKRQVSVNETGGGDLETYVKAHGGTFVLTIFDKDGKVLAGGETINPGDRFKVVMSYTLPYGIIPGTYTTTINATGFNFTADSGKYVVNDVEIGEWSISNGLITSIFYDVADTLTQIVVNASFNITADKDAENYSFDSKVFVKYTAPDNPVADYSGNKKLIPVDDNLKEITDGSTDYNRVYNRLRYKANNDAAFAGTKIVDELRNTMYFSDEDKALGIRAEFKVDGRKHVVYLSDVTWTESTWEWTFPDTLDGVDLTTHASNDYIELYYYCSIKETAEAEIKIGNTGRLYKNDELQVSAQATLVISRDVGTGDYSINKTHTVDGRKINWIVSGTLRGARWGTDKFYNTKITDSMTIKAGSNWGKLVFSPLNQKLIDDFIKATDNLTVKINGVEIPYYTEAGENDEFVYKVSNIKTRKASGSDGGTGSSDHDVVSFDIIFGMKCICTEETCTYWGGRKCKSELGNGYCTCWHCPNEVTFSVEYTTDLSYVEYGDGHDLRNRAQFSGNVGNGDYAMDEVPLYSEFTKHLTDAPKVENGYTASYTIEVNSGYKDYSIYDVINLKDTMSSSLIYIPGTMKIVAYDSQNNSKELVIDTDYTFNRTDASEFELGLLYKGPYKYIITYDALVNITGQEATLDYYNSAEISIDGYIFRQEGESTTLAEISYSAEQLQITIHKSDTDDASINVPGAEYGLYSATGELIVSDVTDENGDITFVTSITHGIILKPHTGYYIKEITPPVGYSLDENRHWFYFCDEEDGCEQDREFSEEYLRIAYNSAQQKTMEVDDSITRVNISVEKIWDDMNDHDEARPDEIVIHLLADEEIIAEKKLSEENDWKWTFEDLPEYAEKKKIVYTVTEEEVKGYTTEISGSAETGIVITNSHAVEKTGNLTIKKTVKGTEDEKQLYFTFTVLFDCEGSFEYTGDYSGWISSGETISLKHGESITVIGLPSGVSYSVTEAESEGFKVQMKDENGVIIENRTVTASFTNTSINNPDTGDGGHILMILTVITVSLAVMAYVLKQKKREIIRQAI